MEVMKKDRTMVHRSNCKRRYVGISLLVEFLLGL
jgi:hypothetical protein